MNRLVRICAAWSLAVVSMLLVACGTSDRAGTLGGRKATTLVVQQAVPTLNPVDLDPAGPSVGDRLEFTATLTVDGKPAGVLTGVLTTQKVGKDDGTAVVKEERTGELTFRLSETDSIEVNGTSRYQPKKKEMDVNEPQVRNVVGGTGTYVGAKGSVSTVHNPDGTYTHTFTLKP